MKSKLKIILLILITFFSINITYAENKCEIKDFKFNDIFEKNSLLNYKNIFLCKNCDNRLDSLWTVFFNWFLNENYNFPEYEFNNNFSQFLIKNNYNEEEVIKINKSFDNLDNFKINTFRDIWLRDDYLKYKIFYYLENCNFNKADETFQILEKYSTWEYMNNIPHSQILLNNIFLDIYINVVKWNIDKVLLLLSDLQKDSFIVSDKYFPYNSLNYELLVYYEAYLTILKNLKTSDEYSWEQYYLDKLNIIKAWENKNFWCVEYLSNWECKTKFPWKENIVVAIIDDWINLNHLDITNKIWTNQKEIPWNKIDDDNNWFVDDFNGWNFYYNDNNTLPMWEHWTAVAWIIWAETNNWIWMAWIIPNAKIMSLWVFDEDWETEIDKIINAVEYAINNWADIINLSLAWTQFIFSQEYNETFKKAYEKNIPIIVSSWNWDTLSSWENWVNTTINKLSPVCNDFENKKIVIWVWSLQENWEKSKWSNYWDCVDFWTFWENIFSLSLLDEESEYWKDYNKFYWTSFSAPTLAWIIWLWINKVWNVSPDLIYDVLEKSLKWNIINTNLFIDNLISLSNEEVKKQEEIRKQESMKKLQEKINQKNEERKKKLEEKNIKKEIVSKENYYNKIIDFTKNKWLEIIAIFFIVLLWIIAFIQNRKNNF